MEVSGKLQCNGPVQLIFKMSVKCRQLVQKETQLHNWTNQSFITSQVRAALYLFTVSENFCQFLMPVHEWLQPT